jgi:hypothetical protein
LTLAEDHGLRRAALEKLGPLGPPLAAEALEHGVLEIEVDVLRWEGSLGQVHGHLVVLSLDADLFHRVSATPAVVDALTAAVAAAVSAIAGNSLAELKIRRRGVPLPSSPYRGRT